MFAGKLHTVCAGETGESNVGAAPAHGGVGAGELPNPIFRMFRRNGCSAAILDARFVESIHGPVQRSGS